MTYTDALMSGFLTGLLVVIAPVAAWLLFRDRMTPAVWGSVAVATCGVAVLSLQTTGFGPGEFLTLGAALMWGLHVVLMSRWSRPDQAIASARIQTATVTGMAAVAIGADATISGRSAVLTVPPDVETWLGVMFLALLATAAALVLLTWAQSRISASRTAVLLTLEPAVAGLAATLLGAELTVRTVIGAALLITAMLVIECGGRGKNPADGRCHSPDVPPQVAG